ncbi:hypothetical protein MP638_000949 [Amoeboaphelidium occidentale]|nr:hypothetical protein MP638_000949 [Amoeboaphelidium occidentale]
MMNLSTKISEFNNSIKEMEEGITKELKELLLLLTDETQQPSATTIPQLKHSVDSLSKRLNTFLDESNVNLTSEEMYGILRKAVEEVEQDYEVVVNEELEEEEVYVHNECGTPPPPAPPAETKVQFNGTPTLESLGLTTASMALLRIKETTSVKTPSKDSIFLHSDDTIPSSPQLHTTLKKKKQQQQQQQAIADNNIKRVSYSSSIIIQSPTLKTQTLSESLVKRATTATTTTTTTTTTTSMLFQQEKENIPSSTTSSNYYYYYNNKNLIREISVEEYNNCLDFSLKSQFSFEFLCGVVSWLNEFLCGVVSWLNEVLQEKFSVGQQQQQEEEEDDDTYYFKKDLYRNFNQNLFNWSDLLEGLDRPAGILLVLMKLKRIERVTTDTGGEGGDKMYRVL